VTGPQGAKAPKFRKLPLSVGKRISLILKWLGIAVLVIVFVGSLLIVVALFWTDAASQAATPPILRGTTSRGESNNGCPADLPPDKIGISPDFSQRLAREFPPGTPSKVIETELARQGFVISPCPYEADVKAARVTVTGFGTLTGVAYWKVDRNDKVVWTVGFSEISGLP
jgi:hypothetical protein